MKDQMVCLICQQALRMQPKHQDPAQKVGTTDWKMNSQSGDLVNGSDNGNSETKDTTKQNENFKDEYTGKEPQSKSSQENNFKESDDKLTAHFPFNKKEVQENGPRMTKKFLRDHCKQQKLYLTPYLNDTLYLHFKGFARIENLEEYTGLKCLWLECNGLQKIENLEAQTELRCLFMQQNLLYRIENLELLKMLDSLNLSNNFIRTIENLSCLTVLNTLQIAHNKLHTVEDIVHLQECPSICVLDLSHNMLDDPNILSVLEVMPHLHVLNLMGNEVIKKISNYRKTCIVRLKHLTYLDDRPVFPKDRACAEAWIKGGRKAEKEEMEKWETKERKKIQKSIDALMKIRQQAEEKKRKNKMEEREEFPVLNDNATNSTEVNPSHSDQQQPEQKLLNVVKENVKGCEDCFDKISSEEELKDIPDNETNKTQQKQKESSAQEDFISTEKDSPKKMSIQGALVTELSEEEVETIPLEIQQNLCIDDLPDLEDVDVSEFFAIDEALTNKKVCPMKIEIISGDSDSGNSEWEENYESSSQKPMLKETATDTSSNIFRKPSHNQETPSPITAENIIEQNKDLTCEKEAEMDQLKTLEPLIQKFSVEDVDEVIMTSEQNESGRATHPNMNNENNKISSIFSGNSTQKKKEQLAEIEGLLVPESQPDNEDLEYGLD
ncbi:dynein assembly factor 1, axonemal isoform X2 [Rhinatrema bivittatum]|uniref:dynein assembly factor 1, axonemal isoform X2 n=1 Tax=Rhinatrema bivittatum TaxID=194408 RepID=UPI00112C1D55|nr:dynein assembly factor 1, axonemal isoform X2 [Rhinatrema bivittatum]